MYKEIATSMLAGYVVSKALKPKSEETKGSKSKKSVYTGVDCPNATSEVVDWSIGSWSYPVPTQEISWNEFAENVEIPNGVGEYIPETVMVEIPKQNSFYDWETTMVQKSIADIEREPEHHESFYKTTLPSGKEFYVWQFGGIEHYFSEDGVMNVEYETNLIDKLFEILSDIEEVRWQKNPDDSDINLEDTLIQMKKLQERDEK